MPDPATRRWAQSVATRPLKPFDFHNLKVDDAAKTKQVLHLSYSIFCQKHCNLS